MLESIIATIHHHGGTAYEVGGYVRDSLMGLESKDLDLEIHGLSQGSLLEILSEFGEVDTIGKSFGVFMIKGLDIDFSMPRTERLNGSGHKGFDVTVDPFIGLETAARRRDFTFNALYRGIDGKVIDLFGGMQDISSRVVRHVDEETFIEDPLRVFRGVQFAGRFGFEIAPETMELFKSMKESISSLPKERIMAEMEKLLLRSEKPSIGLEAMREAGVIESYFPELHALIDCPQSEIHHPEGSVWNHTMLVVDETAKLRHLSENPLALMLAALCHDLGKPATTQSVDGRIISHDHDKEGVSVANVFLRRLMDEKALINTVSKLTEVHMRPFALYRDGSVKGAKRLLSQLSEEEIKNLFLLVEADHRGRGEAVVNEEEIQSLLEWFDSLNVTEESQKPLVTGKDLIDRGLKPGPLFKEILGEAQELQWEGYNREEILARLLP